MTRTMMKFFMPCLLTLLCAVSGYSQYVRGSAQTATWTSSTALNNSDNVLSIDLTSTPYQSAFVFVNGGANLLTGAITFEGGKNSSNVTGNLFTRLTNGATETNYTLVSSTNESWSAATPGPYFQIRLSTAITTSSGTGSTSVVIVPFIGIGGNRFSIPIPIASSIAYEASRVAKASAGLFTGVSGYNSKASAQWIQCSNAASVPADTAVPIITFTAAASSNFSFGLQYPVYWATGTTCWNSSTGPTKTIGSADVWFDIQVQ